MERRHFYRIRLRMWLNKGDPVRWKEPWGSLDKARLEDDGQTLVTEVRWDREFLINGLFYGCQDMPMRVGGRRKLRIAPHLGYGERGVPGVIPESAVLTADIEILDETGGDASNSLQP